MKFVPVAREEIDTKCYKRCGNQKILEDFLDSGLECARLDDWTQKNAYIAAGNLRKSAKHFGLGVDIVSRKGQVYLIRKT